MPRFAAHGFAVQIQRHMRNFRFTQNPGQVATVEPVAHNDDMVLNADLRPF
jgi:hypothetical protein